MIIGVCKTKVPYDAIEWNLIDVRMHFSYLWILVKHGCGSKGSMDVGPEEAWMWVQVKHKCGSK